MAGQRLGRRDRRALRAEHLADRLDLLDVADRRRGGVRVDVVDRRVHAFERHLHAAHRALARRRHHVVAVGGRAIARDLGVDFRAARLGVLQLFEHQHAGAAGDHEAVAVAVIGARGLVRRLVEARRHRAHGVEQHRHGPVEVLAAAGEHHVLLAPLDRLGGVADAVVRGRAGRRDRIVHALDLEPGGERRRRGRRHRLRHRERADALRALSSGWCRAASTMVRVDGPPEPMMMPVRSLETSLSCKPGVADRLLHRDVVPGGAAAEEAHGAAVDGFGRIERGRAVDLAAEAERGVFVGARNAGLGLAQARQHLLGVVADGRDDAHSGDDNPSHRSLVRT